MSAVPLVVGLGNPWRRDDGVGGRVAALVAERAGPAVKMRLHGGDAADLIALWAGHAAVVLVDATVSGAEPGTLRSWDAEAGAGGGGGVGHGFGPDQALALAAALGRLPPRVLVVGIEAGDLGHGEGLSPAVAAAVGPAASLVLAFLNRRGYTCA